MIQVFQRQKIVAGRVEDYIAKVEQPLNRLLRDFDRAHRAELDDLFVFDEQSPPRLSIGFGDQVISAEHRKMNVAEDCGESHSDDHADEGHAEVNVNEARIRGVSDDDADSSRRLCDSGD